MEEKYARLVLPPPRFFVSLTGLGFILLFITVIHFAMFWLPFCREIGNLKLLEGKLYSYLPREDERVGDSAIINVYYLPDINRVFLEYKNRYLFYDELYEEVKKDAHSFVMPNGDIIAVRVCADESVPLQSVVGVLNICKKAGVQKTEIGMIRSLNFDASKIAEKNMVSPYSPVKPSDYKKFLESRNLLRPNPYLKKALAEKGGLAAWLFALCGLAMIMLGVVFFLRINKLQLSDGESPFSSVKEAYHRLNILPIIIFIVTLAGFITVLLCFYNFLYPKYGAYESLEEVIANTYKMLIIIVEAIFTTTIGILIYSYLVNKLNVLISDNELSGTGH